MTAREAIFAAWDGGESLAEVDELHPEPVLDEWTDDLATTIDLLVDDPRRLASVD